RALLPGRAGSGAAAQQRLFWYIVIGTVPAVVFAVLFGDFVESRLRSPLSVAAMLAAGGLLLLAAERFGKHARQMGTLTLADVLLIGFCQALALVPGVSRSGITMTACLLLGIDRPGAVRFSFLLSAPVILGAGVYNLPEIVQHGLNNGQLPFYLSGFFAAAVSGYAVIAFLLTFVRTRSLAPFAYYRFILAGAVLLAVAV
ncbi:MAG: undecaprenyl-diphosphate phosphatase, partial [Pseudomonadota bacterium]